MSRSYHSKLARREFIVSNVCKPSSDLARGSSAGVGVLHYDSSDMILEDGLGHARPQTAFTFHPVYPPYPIVSPPLSVGAENSRVSAHRAMTESQNDDGMMATLLSWRGPEEAPQLVDKDCVTDRDTKSSWRAVPGDPEPLKLVRKFGFGYKKPEAAVNPHWSQWPVAPPQTARPSSNTRARVQTFSPHPPCCPRNHYSQAPDIKIDSWRHEESSHRDMAATTYGDMTSMMGSDPRQVIMARGLSPRRQPPPRLTTRSLTHYGSFGNREPPNPHIGGLDLHANPYNANRGFNQGITSYSTRESRPMHRHPRRACREDDFRHDHSIFYSTTPNVAGNFIIHPDWVSERNALRRSHSLLSF